MVRITKCRDKEIEAVSRWVGRGLAALGFVLWFIYGSVWVYWNRHCPSALDASHLYAYGGHNGPFYVTGGQLFELRALMFGSVGLFVGGGLLSGAGRRPFMYPLSIMIDAYRRSQREDL